MGDAVMLVEFPSWNGMLPYWVKDVPENRALLRLPCRSGGTVRRQTHGVLHQRETMTDLARN